MPASDLNKCTLITEAFLTWKLMLSSNASGMSLGGLCCRKPPPPGPYVTYRTKKTDVQNTFFLFNDINNCCNLPSEQDICTFVSGICVFGSRGSAVHACSWHTAHNSLCYGILHTAHKESTTVDMNKNRSLFLV